ncbi:protein tipE [Drosophila elegans]|uniref:protein tipE n=1 Tax=Drosophila elegans TaxID=30023 RepID=UPI0007E690CC|nr:protein tipE [Drosophila elegans]XP_017127087.1 protein tipE [Drosophila elegans]XP_017127088.1 protein tipE [Drosophila elegans]XP_017127089.1 protein tipE [Drosophila elegans]
MGDEQDKRTGKEKLLFYTTAFFILLGTFSLFAFLFLVPFVIEPAFTTIFMQFEEVPALCETYDTEIYYGAKNCSWASCREGCTKDIYTCTQIRVNYRLNLYNYTDEFNFTEYHINLKESERIVPPVKRTDRYERALRSDYEYDNLGTGGTGLDIDLGGGRLEQLNFGDADGSNGYLIEDSEDTHGLSASGTLIPDERRPFDEISELNEGLMGNRSMYYYVGARLFPNVKGCGYPPMLNCTIWLKRYTKIGMKFPCYYSKVDPSLVISDLDYWQNTLNLVYSMAIPIPSFIISVIYLTYAYFKIYNEDEETAPLDKNAEDMDIDDIDAVDDSDGAVLADNVAGSQIINMDSTTNDSCLEGVLPNGGPGMTASISQGGSVTTPGGHPYIAQSPAGSQMTPNSEMNSFGHQLKVQMADELSRDSLENGVISTSNSVQGNLSKTMTTSISTPPGPTAAV